MNKLKWEENQGITETLRLDDLGIMARVDLDYSDWSVYRHFGTFKTLASGIETTKDKRREGALRAIREILRKHQDEIEALLP